MSRFFSKRFTPATDLPDLKGKVIIVTGGKYVHYFPCNPELIYSSSGIGYQMIKHVARRGGKIYLCARDESKANDAIAWLQAEGLAPGSGEIQWLQLDLTDPRKAKSSALEFIARETRLDVLGECPSTRNSSKFLMPLERSE